MSVALGVPQSSSGVGTSALEMRKIISSLFINIGTIDGLNVKGTSSLYYAVDSGVAICTKGKSDGYAIAYYPGGNTPTVESNSSSQPRIDSIWLTSHDIQHGDEDNLVTIGVSQGVPSSSPVPSSIPSDATIIAYMLLPAGATSTQNAVMTSERRYAIPSGASLGTLLDKTDRSYKGIKAGTPYTYASGQIYVPTDRSLSVKMTETTWAWNPTTHDWIGSGYVDWTLDGVVQNTFRFTNYPETPTTCCFEDFVEVEAGFHTISARLWGSAIAPASDIWLDYTANYWPGQRLIVVDGGVVE